MLLRLRERCGDALGERAGRLAATGGGADQLAWKPRL